MRKPLVAGRRAGGVRPIDELERRPTGGLVDRGGRDGADGGATHDQHEQERHGGPERTHEDIIGPECGFHMRD